AQVAGVGEEEIGLADRVDVAVVLGDARADVRVLGQEPQQLEPREVHVVVAAAADQVGAGGCRHAGSNSRSSASRPWSRTFGLQRGSGASAARRGLRRRSSSRGKASWSSRRGGSPPPAGGGARPEAGGAGRVG